MENQDSKKRYRIRQKSILHAQNALADSKLSSISIDDIIVLGLPSPHSLTFLAHSLFFPFSFWQFRTTQIFTSIEDLGCFSNLYHRGFVGVNCSL